MSIHRIGVEVRCRNECVLIGMPADDPAAAPRPVYCVPHPAFIAHQHATARGIPHTYTETIETRWMKCPRCDGKGEFREYLTCDDFKARLGATRLEDDVAEIRRALKWNADELRGQIERLKDEVQRLRLQKSAARKVRLRRPKPR